MSVLIVWISCQGIESIRCQSDIQYMVVALSWTYCFHKSIHLLTHGLYKRAYQQNSRWFTSVIFHNIVGCHCGHITRVPKIIGNSPVSQQFFQAQNKENTKAQHFWLSVRLIHWWPEDSWWRLQMETFPALLAICVGNSPAPGEFPAQRPVTQSFDVFFDLCPNKRLSKQS